MPKRLVRIIAGAAIMIVMALGAVAPITAHAQCAPTGGNTLQTNVTGTSTSELGKLAAILKINPSTCKSPGQLVVSIAQVILGCIGVILVVLVMYAGYLWMTPAGDKDQVKKSKDILYSALMGLFVLIAAEGFTYFILENLVNTITGKTSP